MLFCIIDGPDLPQAQASLSSAVGKAAGVELRLDRFKQCKVEEIDRLIAPYRKQFQFILTLRSQRQGGAFQGTEQQRLSLLKELCLLNPDYLDLEYDVPLHEFQAFAQQFPHIKLISSYHNFTHTPKDLDHLLHSMSNPYAQIVKIATTATSSIDTLTLLHFVRSHSGQKKLIGIAMGQTGEISRILGPVIGNAFDYACLSQPIAPGQLTIEQMQLPYRYNKLNRQTALYALIGYPVDKSLGHMVHNGIFEKKKENAVYVKIPVSSSELPEWIKLARKLPFKGLSVTMPLKEAVLPLLDDLSPSAKAIGAVNTIAIDNGKWTGHNTDGIGALNALEHKIPVKDKRLVICGAGGSARAIAYEAVQRGARVTILNRTPSKAEHLAHLYHCRGGGFSLFPQILQEGYEILINTIPEGEWIEERWILPKTTVMDIVYVPQNTPFLIKASRKNCTLVYGHEMFLAQAIEQQQLWFP